MHSLVCKCKGVEGNWWSWRWGNLWGGLPTKHQHTNSHLQSEDVWYHRTACCRHFCGWKIEKCDTSINTYPELQLKFAPHIADDSFNQNKVWAVWALLNIFELAAYITGMHCSSALTKNPQSCPHCTYNNKVPTSSLSSLNSNEQEESHIDIFSQ